MRRTSPLTTVDFDRARAQKLVLELMAIPGRSSEEAAVADRITRVLRRAGLPLEAIVRDSAHRRSPHGGQSGNLIVKLPGTRRGPRRMLMAHLDTVPLCVGCEPRRRGRQIVSGSRETGLGADDRAGTAAILVALLETLERRLPHPPLTFLWTVQEELGLVGARYVARNLLGRPRLAFNFDGGSADQLVLGATGATRMVIRISGIAAHAGVHPERGASALEVASMAIARLKREGWLGGVRKGRETGTSNVGSIHGGEATNVVAESAIVRAEARSHSTRFRARIVTAYRRAFTHAARAVRNHARQRARASFECSDDYEAFLLKESEPCVELASRAVREIGRAPVYRQVNGGLDANWICAHGIPTVSLGTGQMNIHTAKESLDLDDFEAGCRLALCVATLPG